MSKVVINKYIVADPQICHGKPTFKGTRIMVWQILEMLSSGDAKKDVLEAFPSLNENHINAALKYASSITHDGHVLINTHPEVSA